MRAPEGSAAEAAWIITAIVRVVIPLHGVTDRHLVLRIEVVVDLEVELFAVGKGAATDIRGTGDRCRQSIGAQILFTGSSTDPSKLRGIQPVIGSKVVRARCCQQKLADQPACIECRAEVIPRRAPGWNTDGSARAVVRSEWHHVAVGVQPLRAKYAEADQISG